MRSIEIDIRNPAQVREAGNAALKNALGVAGSAYFIRQLSSGQGDYTAERECLLEGITLEDIIKDVRERESRSNE